MRIAYKLIALTERISDRRNEKRGREESGIADHLPKRVKKSIPVNTFFKSGVLERVLAYTRYREQREWVRVLDKQSLLKVANAVLPGTVKTQLARRIPKDVGRLPKVLNRYDLALIGLLRRYYTFSDRFRDEYESDMDIELDPHGSAVYKNSQYILDMAPFGFGIRCRYFELPSLIDELLRMGRVDFEYIPPEVQTHSLCVVALRHMDSNLQLIDPELLSEDICMASIRKNGALLHAIPDAFKTREICMVALESPRFNRVLGAIPDEFKTEAICLKEIQRNPLDLENVPDALKTEEMCDLALRGRQIWSKPILKVIPDRFKTFDRCVQAFVFGYQNNLTYVPAKFLTFEFFMAIVKLHGHLLKFVPSELLTESLCLEAVQQDGKILELIPLKFKTPEICLVAVRQKGAALLYVPESHRTPDLCLEAVKHDGKSLKYMSMKEKTDEVFLAALNQTAAVFHDIPASLKTKENCISAVKRDLKSVLTTPNRVLEDDEYCAVVSALLVEIIEKGEPIPFVPPTPFFTEAVVLNLVAREWALLSDERFAAFRTEAVCMAALAQSWEALAFVPDEIKTELMCHDALGKDLRAIKHVPKAFKTDAFFLKLVKKNPLALEVVPEKFKTPELCMVAVEQDSYALKFMPEDLRYALLRSM